MNQILAITPVSDLNLQEHFTNHQFIPSSARSLVDLEHNTNVIALIVNPNQSNILYDSSILDYFPNLKAISTASTGTNHLDIPSLASSGIEVFSLTEERDAINSISSTAELAFSLLLLSTRNLIPAITSVKSGVWDYEPFIGRQLKELHVGIVGYGRLGTYFAHYCRAFGAKVSIFDPYSVPSLPDLSWCSSIHSLFSNCDAVSLHVHVTPETRHFISMELLNLTKPHFTLINTSRGAVCDEASIATWLSNSPTHIYATDVIDAEIGSNVFDSPLVHEFLNSNQLILTPHIGGMTFDARSTAYTRAASLLSKFLES